MVVGGSIANKVNFKMRYLLKLLHSDSHKSELRLPLGNHNFTHREISNKLGFSVSELNYCLNVLIHKVCIKINNLELIKKTAHYNNLPKTQVWNTTKNTFKS